MSKTNNNNKKTLSAFPFPGLVISLSSVGESSEPRHTQTHIYSLSVSTPYPARDSAHPGHCETDRRRVRGYSDPARSARKFPSCFLSEPSTRAQQPAKLGPEVGVTTPQPTPKLIHVLGKSPRGPRSCQDQSRRSDNERSLAAVADRRATHLPPRQPRLRDLHAVSALIIRDESQEHRGVRGVARIRQRAAIERK
ncbi:hypothetical protein JZ751_011826 [Albula glossodonta]|uniref:Uncharacterized protein n=1 Tax=Albula glossodonta TaxID=121402 RepID=A0A8T2PQS9_9TELE|nr:hypothetical protein JZ751_011826 [Albula glossodonta]